jgi:hypothetical protein
VSGLLSLDVRVISPALAGLLRALAVGPGGVRGDSARSPATLNTSRRIALLPGRMKNQYAANNRRVLGSVAVTRVSVLSRVPAAVGSTRNSMATLIHRGCDQARKAAASRRGACWPAQQAPCLARPIYLLPAWLVGRRQQQLAGRTFLDVTPIPVLFCRPPQVGISDTPALSGLLPPAPAPPRASCPQLQPGRCGGPAVVLAHLHSNQQRLTVHETGAAGIHDLLRRADPDPMTPPRSLTQPLGHSLRSQWWGRREECVMNAFRIDTDLTKTGYSVGTMRILVGFPRRGL